MKRINYILVILSITLLSLIVSCNKQESNDITICSREHSIQKFSSREELLNALSTAETKSGYEPSEGEHSDGSELFEDIIIDLYYDPIVSIDCDLDINDPLVEGGSLTIYEAGGYDELVPNLNLAKLLNVRGELEICDTIYKISNKGTYYFHVRYT